MIKAIGSRVNLNEYDRFCSIEYNEIISDLIDHELVQELKNYNQHLNTTRFQHCINVSYYSYLLAKFLHLDYVSAARGALLHDLFFYNFKDADLSGVAHSKLHPLVSIENAKKVTELNPVETDIIVKHMWPMTTIAPKYKESYIVSFVDKYCASAEVVGGAGLKKIKKMFTKLAFRSAKKEQN